MIDNESKCFTKGQGIYPRSRASSLPEANRAIAALQAKVDELEERERWIPVDERLPDTDRPLHVMIKARRAGGELYARSLSYLPGYSGFDHHYDTVIAWKPINSPKDE